jgi:methylated-DNA-protein-cysteine methyltransferase-like protein
MPVKKSTTKLKPVKPSGKREENFFELVFEVARQIPKGRVTSYGAIAASLGTKSSARMVGWAMNGSSNVRPKVPAHRVVNRNGILSGKHHFADPTEMEKRLKKEGVKVKDDTIVDFDKVFWDPAEGLSL